MTLWANNSLSPCSAPVPSPTACPLLEPLDHHTRSLPKSFVSPLNSATQQKGMGPSVCSTCEPLRRSEPEHAEEKAFCGGAGSVEPVLSRQVAFLNAATSGSSRQAAAVHTSKLGLLCVQTNRRTNVQ